MNDDTDKTDAERAADRARLQARLDHFKATQKTLQPETDGKPGSMQGMAQGLKIASEFIAGVVVGAVIGYGIDQLFGTTPFGLIVFLLLGFAAGVLNVIRSASQPTPPSDPPSR
ncbi:AtpZ/AtpI family protein [uncultured Aureimonas sp.]|uniref:AtpZ/AtpI family protein n=1 Tax=uncultured Aureimonas sp. TaxID=1604662 RepID=UPI0025E06B42|nr:AtpZ/AtpI family protein [uncultured Aureimonas sp.]